MEWFVPVRPAGAARAGSDDHSCPTQHPGSAHHPVPAQRRPEAGEVRPLPVAEEIDLLAPAGTTGDDLPRRATARQRATAMLAVAGAAVGGVSVIGAALPSLADQTPEPVAAPAAFTLAPQIIPAGPAAVPVDAAEPVSVPALAGALQAAGERADAERQRIEAQARAAEERARAAAAAQANRRSTGPTSCGMSTAGLGAVKPWVAKAVEFIGCQFGQPDTLGVGSRGNASDHPSGLAADFMTDSRATGDAIAACALKNMNALGVTYVIWQQRINYGSGWQAMEDRGSPTANHEDHVHVSFRSSAPSGTPVAC